MVLSCEHKRKRVSQSTKTHNHCVSGINRGKAWNNRGRHLGLHRGIPAGSESSISPAVMTLATGASGQRGLKKRFI